MQDWPGLLLMRPDRMGMVKNEPEYAGIARIIVD